MKLIIKALAIMLFILNSPLASAQCANPSNIYSFVYNGKSYEVVKENKTWVNAAACAVARGGALMEINNLLEQNAVFTEIDLNAGITVSNTVAPDGGGGAYVWLGGNDLSVEGNWIWDGNNDNVGPQFWLGTSTGSVVGGLYNNWGNEPDDFNGQDALALSLNGWPLGVTGEWNDVDHTNTLYYVIEYSSIICNTSSTLTDTACDSYTSPSGNYVWTSSNTYIDTIPNTANCDSIITINLTINTVDTSVTQTGTLLNANETGATYQWLNCPSMIAINGANSQSYNAIANGDYALMISKNGCTDTSNCYSVNGIGIIENNFGKAFQLYPNPTDGELSIDLGSTYSEVSVTLTDMNGKLIQSRTYKNHKLLNLRLEVPAGNYLMTIESGQKKTMIRLVKE
jgi:hypothetical protein